MPASFPRTLRHLASEEPRPLAWNLVAVAVVLLGLVAWSIAARVEVVERSTAARVVLQEAVHPIVAPVAGRVVAVNLELGARTQIGDVLVELDTELQRRRQVEARRRLDAIERERIAVLRQIEAKEELLQREQEAAHRAVEVAAGYEAEARASADLAGEQRQRDEQAGASIPELERVRSRAAERQARALVRARAGESLQAAAEQRAHESRLAGEVAALRREVVALEGEAAALAASVAVLEQEIEVRRIRATAEGRIGEGAPLQIGSVLTEGAHVGTIVQEGELKILASFPVARALGRIAPGQPAWMRLDAFPWTEFGSLAATVRRVASEHRDGLVTVELAVASSGVAALQHGLTGVVGIEVEQVSPARLVLRAAGAR